ncbi:MAG: copper chaperone PCu(A)C [Pseudomonadota bacterium]
MTKFKALAIAATAALFAVPAIAADIVIEDAYARASTPTSKSGAAFMMITNSGEADDRLVSASSEIAARVELHTHIEDGDVMRMVEVEEGFALPAGQTVMLERGGKHVMFLGLNTSLEQGNTVEVTLTFEKAGDVSVEIPVDLKRMPEGHGGMDHSNHSGHSN